MESAGISPTRESIAPVRCFDVPKNLAMPRKFNALVIDLNQRRHAQTIDFLYARGFSPYAWLRDFAYQRNIEQGRVMCGSNWYTPREFEALRERSRMRVRMSRRRNIEGVYRQQR